MPRGLEERYNKPAQRETVPLLISDKGIKTVSVIVHSFLLPYRANSGLRLSIGTIEVSSELRLK